MTTEISNFYIFLRQIHHLHETREKLSQLNGENFNIFHILQMERSERYTHSAFLCELLNPEGTHAMGNKFLELFLKKLKIEDTLDKESSKAITEKHIGRINDDFSKGGYIDLLIEDKTQKRIIIENKIDAKDQKNQLLRYSNFDPEAVLFYLTLYGGDASEKSKGGKQFEYRCISYSKEILEWLKECRKEAVEKPVVRETLSQYIRLIEHLTNQTAEDAMSEEIKSLLINNPDLVDSIQKANQVWGQIKEEVSTEFWDLINKEFPMRLDPFANNFQGEAKCAEDSDGVYVAFFISQNNKNICANDLATQQFNILKTIEPTMVKRNDYIGWYTPKPFKRYTRISGLAPQKIIQMYKRREEIKTTVQGIVDQTRKIWKKFSEEQSI